MLAFGQAVLLWRAHRGLTQEALARRAGIPRPNLSAIERGRREVSLATLRTLAAGLEVRPGVLADGVGPGRTAEGAMGLSRDAVERIATAAAFNRRVADPDEQVVVSALRMLTRPRLGALTRQWRRPRVSRRAVAAAWMTLKSRYPREALQALADRILERQAADASSAH